MVDKEKEANNRRRGLILSVVTHTLLIALLAFFTLSWQDPPPEPGGILVNLGIPDVGQGDENAPEGKPAPAVEEVKPDPEPTPPPPQKETAKPKPEPNKVVKETEDPEAARIKREKEKQRQEQQAKDRERQEQERQKKAQEAREKAEREKAAADKARKEKELQDMVGGALGGGSGSGKGNTGSSGNQGNPDGDPNADALSGIGGGGNIGGALGNRGVAYRPGNFKHSCPQTGTLVVWVCVDESGTVTKAEFRQSGSQVNATCNKNAAIAHAKKYRFDKGSQSDCGPITYDFTVK